MKTSIARSYDYTLDEAQEAGNNLLRTTISNLRQSLIDILWIPRSQEDQSDKGIDFEYQLEDKITGKQITNKMPQLRYLNRCSRLTFSSVSAYNLQLDKVS